ncbi:MAG: outer membrane protein transport protein [Myxococcales bacterium]|nr:outer membrane protein transport protein [Myxococcales bacterium]
MKSWGLALAAAAATLATPARGSGIYFGENGTKALLQGGAFAAQADDLTAIQHNPGGLSQLAGFHFLLDTELLRHEVGFLRKDPGAATTVASPVSNTAGFFFLPNLAFGYGMELAGRPVTFAVGAYGPPAVGRYKYPRPNYAKKEQDVRGKLELVYVEHPRKAAPQRYELIDNDVIILYPSLSAAAELHPRLSVGASFQYVFSKLALSQAVHSAPYTPSSISSEDPGWDSVVGVDLMGKGGWTGVLGVLARPTDSLSIGASVRPPVQIAGNGKFIIEPGELARSAKIDVQCPNRELTELDPSADANSEVDPGEAHRVSCPGAADLFLTMPLEVKLGLRYRATEALALNLDFVYQGWQSVSEIVLEPKGITIQTLGGEPQPVQTFHIPKRWHKAASLRLGGSYSFPFGLTAYGGVLGEEGAAPDEYSGIDFLHYTRLFLTAGAGYRTGGLEFLAGAAYTPTVVKEVSASEVRAGSTDPAIQGIVVGAGAHSSGGLVLTAGIRGRFGNTARGSTSN